MLVDRMRLCGYVTFCLNISLVQAACDSTDRRSISKELRSIKNYSYQKPNEDTCWLIETDQGAIKLV